ncbi:MAG: aminoacyl-tRNA hydrolase [Burkholderiaceae bacterium]
MPGIKLIAGLGNIGSQYEQTRHNAGFWFADLLALRYSGEFSRETRFNGDATRVSINGRQVWLLKPSTLMNLSGQAVAGLANFYKIDPEEILVVHDELDLLPGQAKLKLGGGVAGHNGLKDIRARCGSADFWRLRIGIGHPRELGLRQQVADFVLRPPSTEHRQDIEQAMDSALDAITELTSGEFEAAMLRLHTASGRPPGTSA